MAADPPRIESYSFGRIVIDGETYTRDVIVTPDSVMPEWWRREGHSLAPEDLGAALEAGPEVFLIGRGASGVLTVPGATREWIEAKGVAFEALPTAEAVERYNALSPKRRVAAGLHLTC
jgi:hypothetical protein